MNRKQSAMATLFSVFLLTAIGYGFLISYPPAPKSQSVQDSVITEMISRIDEPEIYNTVHSLQDFTTRRYGYSGNIEAATYLYSRLDNISGLNVEYQSSYMNIIATLHGNDSASNATYMVGAHYDSTSSNQSNAPGATDNGGGVGIVVELARIMSQYRFNHTLMFALWNAEENGVLGSSDYAKYAYGNKLNISLYINFDSACYDPNALLILDIMYNDKSGWVSDMMAKYDTLYNIDFALTYNSHTCSSDHKPFWQYGYTAVMTHEGSHGPAHSSDDTLDRVSTLYAKKNGQLGMSVLAKLAEVQGTTQRISEFPSPLVPPMLMTTTSPALIGRARLRRSAQIPLK